MTRYVLHRTDQSGGFVQKPGSKKSYGPKPTARVYPNYEAAAADSCDNEVPVKVGPTWV